MRFLRVKAALLLLSPLFLLAAPQGGIAQKRMDHDRDFWRAIAKNRYAVPQGEQVFPLVGELSSYVGSTDSELRDELSYTILESWIVEQEKLTPAELQSLAKEWQTNLQIGTGESGTDTVFKRSFSALCLSLLAERDHKRPFLDEEHYRELLKNALAYLRDEHDLRGFDPVKGWIHATAHTADLLAVLADNKFFKPADQGVVLDAIELKMSSAREIFSYGEQNRLAAVAATIVLRTDFDVQAFQQWLTNLNAADQKTWKDSPPKLNLLQTFENNTYFLRGLVGYLQVKSPDPRVVEVQKAVIQSLRNR
jgi:Protein of unknown function (DUF2785)